MPAAPTIPPEFRSPAKRTAGWPKRINLVILFFTCNLICYMDRINISVTAPVMMKELGWDEAALGIILSSFFWGYTLLQIPGGWLADRYGGKRKIDERSDHDNTGSKNGRCNGSVSHSDGYW